MKDLDKDFLNLCNIYLREQYYVLKHIIELSDNSFLPQTEFHRQGRFSFPAGFLKSPWDSPTHSFQLILLSQVSCTSESRGPCVDLTIFRDRLCCIRLDPS